ncbi:SLBB domain-containing protein [Flavobacterium sp.]|uniref:SLBB domain-containing protein n=1 Tax=Flavobacterium sp. TaxID=239 RepID=UPI002626A82B|nr:SLBB domain-containing protein [Flavobacterium sp.]MDG2433856.1 SLBB domain-containing protein [Flavobacterium sp.]
MKKIMFAMLLFVSILMGHDSAAQGALQSRDLTTINVDALSPSDIAKIQSQLSSNGMTIDQAQSGLLAKGMSASEFEKLKGRLSNNNVPALQNTTAAQSGGAVQQLEITNVKVKDTENALIFGSELFDNPTLDFAPDLQLATPVNYVLGPGDELQISVYGVQLYNATIKVSPEGKIAIDAVGQLYVSGMTIEAATQKIRNAIAGVYSTVASGQSQVSVSLGKIRTIKVTIIGGKQPGNYSVSSLASVYNALHLAGGPSKNGSYRNIELIRNNQVIKYIDIYDFLVKGDQSANVNIKDNDVIRIPAYTKRVTLEGEVKRPGIFELKKGETFSTLLSFASSFSESAYTASVNVTQKTSKEFKVQDISKSEFATYIPQAGDIFKVNKILDRFENRISIEGAVFRPETYAFTEGMRVSDLIAKADGLKEDAYNKRARILRITANLTAEVINVDLENALSGNLEADIVLNKEDVLTVYSILDFTEDFKITIDGEIKKPGVYNFYQGLTLNDLLIQAGGLSGSASKRVEIARMIVSEDIDNNNPNKAELFNIEITPDNNEQVKNFVLNPFDVINIRKMAVYEKPQSVSVVGAVHYAGKYVLASKVAKVADIIERAGGLTTQANSSGVKIKRPIQAKQIEAVENIDLNLGVNDSIQKNIEKRLKDDVKYAIIPVDWEAIVKNPLSSTNVRLVPGDIIEVATFNEGVKVAGNVLLTSEIPYIKGKGFRYYLDAVGGLDAKAWKKKSYIIYPNGKAAVTHSFLFFKSYPKVTPGSQIIVPEKPETTKLNTTEVVSIGSVIASLALLIITAFK